MQACNIDPIGGIYRVVNGTVTTTFALRGIPEFSNLLIIALMVFPSPNTSSTINSVRFSHQAYAASVSFRAT